MSVLFGLSSHLFDFLQRRGGELLQSEHGRSGFYSSEEIANGVVEYLDEEGVEYDGAVTANTIGSAMGQIQRAHPRAVTKAAKERTRPVLWSVSSDGFQRGDDGAYTDTKVAAIQRDVWCAATSTSRPCREICLPCVHTGKCSCRHTPLSPLPSARAGGS